MIDRVQEVDSRENDVAADQSEGQNVEVVNDHHARQDIHRERAFDAGRPRYRFALRLIKPTSESLKVADIGGGAGEFTALLRDLGYQTVLVDGNQSSVERERERGSEAYQADLNHGIPSLERESVDGAVCLEVIEHIVQAENLLREIQRIVRPGGFLVLSTPNFSFLIDRIAYAAGRDVKEEGYHFRFFTKSKLRKMLEDAGFEIVDSASFGGLLGINFILKCMTLGKFRVKPIQIPHMFEPLLARTFVYRLRRL